MMPDEKEGNLNIRRITFPSCPIIDARATDAQWNGCPSGKVTQYKKNYLALGACPMSQPVNLMPRLMKLTPLRR